MEHVKTLIKQGKFLEMCNTEKTDATWNSYIFNLPKGTMKFILNSTLDTLPTKTNLKQWGKLTNDKCFCGQRQTLNHILNGCRQGLEQGRFTYRHDCVLNYISKCLDRKKFTCYLDINDNQTPTGGTLPPSLIVTRLKPDLVIVDETKKTLHIFELTVPGDLRISIAHNLKMDKYQHFSRDITSYKTTVVPFEIGSHTGQITRDNKKNLHLLHTFCEKDIKLKNFLKNISTIVLLGSYHIFNCRNETSWTNTSPILAPFPNQ